MNVFVQRPPQEPIMNLRSRKTLQDILQKERESLTFKEREFSRNRLLKEFRFLVNNGFTDHALQLLEDYSVQYPNSHTKHMLFGVICYLINHAGDTATAKGVSLIFIRVTNIIANIGKSLFGLPPIVDHAHLLYRIGELVNQTSSVAGARELGIITEKPVLICKPELDKDIANKAILPYLSDIFEIVSKEADVTYYLKMKEFSPYSTVFHQYSEDLWGFHDQTRNGLNRLLLNDNKTPFYFELKEETSTVALRYLKKFGLSKDDKFIVFHCREGGNIYDNEHTGDRNYSPSSFEPSLKYILSQGLKVIRIGNYKMSPITKMIGLIDLTKENHPAEVDIFASARAEFFLGNPSGPNSLAYYFNTPNALVGLSTWNYAYSGMFTALQPMYDITTGEKLGFQERLDRAASEIEAPKTLRKKNIVQGRLSAQEILDFTKEMFEFLSKGNIVRENLAYNDKKTTFGIDSDVYYSRLSLQLLH